jgi:D-alanine transaminase
MTTVYLNGKFLPKDQAFISVMDRGFLFGDGVYEVLPVYNGKLFQFQQHIERLNSSLAAIKLPLHLDYQEWEQILTQLLQYNSECGPNQSIYFQVTRGYSPERNHAFPATLNPTWFAISQPLKTLSYEELKKGKRIITAKDTRWQLCNIKATSLLANVLLYQDALDQQCAETILIRDGYAIEGATSNLFIVKDGVVITAPLSAWILGGITRDLVLKLARENHIPCEERLILEKELFSADEVWITSSTREIYPIIQVDNTLINKGLPGELWHKIINLYHIFIKNL